MKPSEFKCVCQAALCVALLAIAGCSPALNWREVQLNRLQVLLPCKPDRAQRSVPMAQTSVAIEMAGCEAGGALFAASHIHVERADDVPAVLQAWRASTLENLRAQGPAVQEDPAAKGPNVALRLKATGSRTDGKPLQAQLAWFVSGTDIFHVAVYADAISPEMSDTLFSQARIQ